MFGINLNLFPPTQRKIFRTLADGQEHEIGELMGCLEDPYAEQVTMLIHISNMRRVLRCYNLDILRKKDEGPIRFIAVRVEPLNSKSPFN